MAHDVFVSHSSNDKTIADAVCATLEGRGIRCWVAPRDILAGANWGESIVDAITDSEVMVLVLSANSNVSQQVMREVERAVNKGTVIIPLRVEDIPLSKSLEYFLSTAHWLDAYSGPLSGHLEELSDRVEQLISGTPLPDRPLTPSANTVGTMAMVSSRSEAALGIISQIWRWIFYGTLSAAGLVFVASMWPAVFYGICFAAALALIVRLLKLDKRRREAIVARDAADGLTPRRSKWRNWRWAFYGICSVAALAGIWHVRTAPPLSTSDGQAAAVKTGADEPESGSSAKSIPQAVRNTPVKFDYSNSLGMTFRLIRSNAFLMGAENSLVAERESISSHRVRISRPFYMAQYEITQSAFETVMERHPSAFAAGGRRAKAVKAAVLYKDLFSPLTAHHPVDSVTWSEAVGFCERLSKMEGRTYRLPTEAEWEFACRGGTATRFFWGDDLADGKGSYVTATVTPLPVGSRLPNGLGLYDMLGNVAEWCHDSFSREYYLSSASVDPPGPAGKTQFKVIRGGAFNQSAFECYKRHHGPLDHRAETVGFRVVLELTDDELDKYRKEREKHDPELKLPPLEKLIAPPGHLKKAAVLVEQARTAYIGKNYAVAREALSGALRLNPGYHIASVGKWPVRNLADQAELTAISGLIARQLVSSDATRSQIEEWAEYYNRSIEETKQGNHHGAIRALVKACAAGPKEDPPGWGLNNLAYTLATCPEKQIRDVQAAIEFSKRACELTDWQYWAFLGTLAQCYSASGDFEKAARVTEAILKNLPEKKIEGSGEPTIRRQEWEFNLKLFKEGKPWQDLPDTRRKAAEKSKEPAGP